LIEQHKQSGGGKKMSTQQKISLTCETGTVTSLRFQKVFRLRTSSGKAPPSQEYLPNGIKGTLLGSTRRLVRAGISPASLALETAKLFGLVLSYHNPGGMKSGFFKKVLTNEIRYPHNIYLRRAIRIVQVQTQTIYMIGGGIAL